jgi:hypothetical protein
MTIKKTYSFITFAEARSFSKKYSKIWFVTSPIQSSDGWNVIRFI